jgi:hypothetical protein
MGWLNAREGQHRSAVRARFPFDPVSGEVRYQQRRRHKSLYRKKVHKTPSVKDTSLSPKRLNKLRAHLKDKMVCFIQTGRALHVP